jgi:glucan phosphoethanolaminetransferase (alkaline phosphatase superfamily)
VSPAPSSLYLESEFWILVVASMLAPVCVFTWLVRKRKISRLTVTMIAIALLMLSGIDAIALQRLSAKAKATPGLGDDRVFASEFSLALYLVPLITAGLGINLLSHVLNRHLIIAELEYDLERDLEQPETGNRRDSGG